MFHVLLIRSRLWTRNVATVVRHPLHCVANQHELNLWLARRKSIRSKIRDTLHLSKRYPPDYESGRVDQIIHSCGSSYSADSCQLTMHQCINIPQDMVKSPLSRILIQIFQYIENLDSFTITPCCIFKMNLSRSRRIWRGLIVGSTVMVHPRSLYHVERTTSLRIRGAMS